MNLEESVKMNLWEFEWMNMCVFLVDLEGKVNGFGNEFCKN